MEAKDLLQKFRHGANSGDRLQAGESLIENELLNEENLEEFAQGVFDDDEGIKDFTSRSLANIIPKLQNKAAEIVAKFIAHNDIEIRNFANDILQKLGLSGAIALRPYLDNEDFDVRKFAVDIIGLTGEPYDIDLLIPAIKDADANVRVSAIEAIGNIAQKYPENIDIDQVMKVFQESFIEDEELRPIIIEAAGKTNSKEGEFFILSTLERTDDEFIRTACIDALALGGNSSEICERLMEQLPLSNKQFQLIILRTIYAIAFRLEIEISLPDELRYIAHNALKDNDEEIRGAGLLALGNSYQKDDVPYLIAKFNEDDNDTHQYIIYHLLASSDSGTVDIFFDQFSEKYFMNNPLGAELDFYGILASVWDDAITENRLIAADKMYEIALKHTKGKSHEIVDLMLKLENERMLNNISRTLDSADENDIYEALDIIEQLKLTDFKNKIKSMKWNSDKLDYKASSIIF
jgi:HEAT repeat protein